MKNKKGEDVELVDVFTVKEEDIPSSDYFVVGTVRGFDEKNNSRWKDEKNKSFPREGLACSKCEEPVVMSNLLFRRYEVNPQPEKILCIHCMMSEVGK